MTLGRTWAVGLVGITGRMVQVEADVGAGLPTFTVGGLPDAACAQAPDRIRAATANAGLQLPSRKVVVNLSPADLRKRGTGYDLSDSSTWHTWNMTTRAAVYVRISQDRRGAGLGVDAQERDCRALVERMGWQVVAVHSDNDLSAYSGKPRPGYDALMRDIAGGAVDVVVAWHEDRLHRSPRELEDYIDACSERQVPTQFVQAGELDLVTASGRMTARIRGAVARGEVEHMVERMTRAKLRSAEAGRWKGGRRPFGYKRDGTTPEPVEADALARAATEVLAGRSLRAVAREWNAAGLHTSMGNTWTGREVRAVLLRPRNAGLMEHRGEVIGRGEWPAVIEEATWHALVAYMRSPGRGPTPSTRRHLGSGLYACGVCGAHVVASSVPQGSVYRCSAGGHVARLRAEVDGYVRAVVAERLRLPDARGMLEGRTEGETSEALEARSVALRSKLDNLAELFAADVIDARQLAEGSKVTRAELEAVHAELAEVRRGSVAAEVADAPDPGDAFLAADTDTQRAVIDALCSVRLERSKRGRPKGWKPGDSYFRPETVTIEWRQA